MLKISVIIPIYNSSKYLRKCLDSVANQHFKDLEVILIDDASTDDSLKICDEYAAKDERFIALHHTENLGTAAARNTGLDHATGQFVYFLDSDLWIDPGCIGRLAKNMVDHDADISICSYITEYEDAKKPQHLSYTPIGTWTPKQWIINAIKADTHSYLLWNRMFKRKLFADTRFEEGNCYAEVALLPEIMESAITISSFDRALIHYTVRDSEKERNADERLLDKLPALDRKRVFYSETYPDFVWFVDREIVMHCVKILELRARHGSCDALEAALPEILERISSLYTKRKVCPRGLKFRCRLVLKAPALFSALARRKKD